MRKLATAPTNDTSEKLRTQATNGPLAASKTESHWTRILLRARQRARQDAARTKHIPGGTFNGKSACSSTSAMKTGTSQPHSPWYLKQYALTILLALSFVSCGNASANAVSIPSIPTTRQTVEGDGYGGEGYTVLPLLSDEPQATAIIIHGLGGTGQEWGVISLALSFFSLNYVKFIVPSAPVQPVSYLNEESMPSWFDIRRLTRNSADVDRDQLLSSMDRIHRIIRGEVRSGVKAARIFIIGFSQGGALALTSFLRSPWNIGGCVGVATWLPLHTEYPQERSSKIEDKDILMLHGSEDEAVRPAFARASREELRRIGQNVSLTIFEGQPHILMNAEVIQSIEDFVGTRAPGTTQYLKTLVKDLTDTFAGLTSSLDRMPRF